MGSLIQKFSIVGIVSQFIWAILLFSSFNVEHLMSSFGEFGPVLIGVLALATLIGWSMMVAFLYSNDEIESKTIWLVALLFLPGQFIFWIKFIQNAEAMEKMNDPTFDRNAFLEEYKVEPKPSTPKSKPALRRPRGLTPPAFIALNRKPDDSQPRL